MYQESEEGEVYNKYISDMLKAVQDQSSDSIEVLHNLLAMPPEDDLTEISVLFGAILQIAILPQHEIPTTHYATEIIVEKIRLLLKAGADIHIAYHPLINMRNSFNKLPIHNVCSLAHLKFNRIRKKILQLLLDHGADPNSHDSFKNTPLHYICHMGDFVCIDENGNASVDFDCIQLLIDHGADLNAANHIRNVPLITCISSIIQSENTVSYNKNLYDIAKYLLENGADPDANRFINDFDRTSQGITPLWYSLESNNFETAKLLLDYGAHANIPCILKHFDFYKEYYMDSPIIKLLEENISIEKGGHFKRACNLSEVEEDVASEADADETYETDLSILECKDRYVELVISAIIQYMEDVNIEPDQIEKMRQYIDYTFGFDSTVAELPFEEFIKYPNLRKMTILALERWEAENYKGMSVTTMGDVRNMLEHAKYLETQTI